MIMECNNIFVHSLFELTYWRVRYYVVVDLREKRRCNDWVKWGFTLLETNSEFTPENQWLKDGPFLLHFQRANC